MVSNKQNTGKRRSTKGSGRGGELLPLNQPFREQRTPAVTYLQYQASWAAFQERPSAAHISKTVGISLRMAQHLIDSGWPDLGFDALSERLRAVNKLAQRIEDYNLAQAMAHNSQILRGVKIRLLKVLGKSLENLSFDEKSFRNMTPKDAETFGKFLDKIMRLEAFALRRGADKSIVDGRLDKRRKEDTFSSEGAQVGKALSSLHSIIYGKELPPEIAEDAELMEDAVIVMQEELEEE